MKKKIRIWYIYNSPKLLNLKIMDTKIKLLTTVSKKLLVYLVYLLFILLITRWLSFFGK